MRGKQMFENLLTLKFIFNTYRQYSSPKLKLLCYINISILLDLPILIPILDKILFFLKGRFIERK